MNRRGFSGLVAGIFGGGAAAKAGIIAPIAPSAGGAIGVGSGLAGSVLGEGAKMGTVKELSHAAKFFIKRRKLLEAASIHHSVLRAVGIIPQHIKDSMWSKTKRYHSYSVDEIPPDIGCLKSVSTTAKFRIIREQEYKKAQDEWWDRPSKALKELLLRKEKGLERTSWGGHGPYAYENDEFNDEEDD